MRISYNWLQTFFIKKLPKPERMSELFTMHTAEVESVRRVKDDYVFALDILPNRTHDLLSHVGMAREIAALLGMRMKVQPSRIRREVKNITIGRALSVHIRDSRLAPRYSARVILDLRVGPSPHWLQERLEALGVRTINNVVDATNYVMMEMGQPLHAFDLDKLQERKTKRKNGRAYIAVRRARRGEKLRTLDGEVRNLDGETLVIANEKKPVAIAGIMGGEETEVESTTSKVMLEAAVFHPPAVRRASKKLGLRTESSLRFEGGIDESLPPQALRRVTELILKIAGGTALGGMIDVYPRSKSPTSAIILELAYLNGLLGSTVRFEEVIRILKGLGCAVKPVSREKLAVTPPSFRKDLAIREDLVEEIGRIRGYEAIPAAFLNTHLIPPKDDALRMLEGSIRDTLRGIGYTEVYNYSFIRDADASYLSEYAKKGLFSLENPISPEFYYLRPTLIPGLLGNARKNIQSFDALRLFEVGKVYLRERNPREHLHIGLVVSRRTTRESRGEEFYECKAGVLRILESLGVTEGSFRPLTKHAFRTSLRVRESVFHTTRSAAILVDTKEVGLVGEIHPHEEELGSVYGRIAVAELDFHALSDVATSDTFYQPISRFPALIRDVAVLVDRGTIVEEVLNVISRVGGKLVSDVDLFDLYEGEEIPEGKKNIAFHIIYQAEDRTLSEREIDSLHERISAALEEMGWEVR